MGVARKCVPNKLKWYRNLEGYTQKDVAKILRFKTPAIICSWERSLSCPSLEYVLKLSMLYHTLPAELFCDLNDDCREELLAAIKRFKDGKSTKN